MVGALAERPLLCFLSAQTVAACTSSAAMTSTSEPSDSFTITPRDACTLRGLILSSLSSCSYLDLQAAQQAFVSILPLKTNSTLCSRMSNSQHSCLAWCTVFTCSACKERLIAGGAVQEESLGHVWMHSPCGGSVSVLSAAQRGLRCGLFAPLSSLHLPRAA